MSDSKRYFHPETIKRISRLELRSRYIVEGLLSGMHRSPFFGQSIEFRQHRDYVQGDDLRHVDWKVWARQDRLYIKQYEEETDLRCHLLVDGSQSMSYQSGPFSKYEYAATLACCLAYLVIRQKDAIGCTLFSDRMFSAVPCKGRSTQLDAIATLLDSVDFQPRTGFEQVGKDFSATGVPKGLVVLISDFLEETDAILSGLRGLKQAGHDVLMIQVLDPDEIDFPFDGPTHFEGLETDEELKCHPAAFRDSYRDALADHQHALKQVCSSTGADIQECRTDAAFNTVLSSLLNRRHARQRS